MNLRAMLTTPLTPARAARLRRHLALLPVYGWMLFAWGSFASDNATTGATDRSGHIKGHDFAHFYVLGQIGAEHATSDLYDYKAQSARLDTLGAQSPGRFLPVYPPQLAVALAPLGRSPYLTALGWWWGLSALVYAVCCWCVWRFAPAVRQVGPWPALILAAGFPALHSVIAFGQTSAFALGLFTLAWVAFHFRRPFLAGLALGALAYKPSLCLVFPVVLLFSRRFSVLAGAAVSGALQLAVAAAWFGPRVFEAFADNTRSLVTQVDLLEPQPWQMHSLRSFFSLLLPSPTPAHLAYFFTALATMWLAVRVWQSTAPLAVQYAVLLFATILVDPHVNSYDLVVLICAFLLIAAWMLDQSRMNWRLFALLAVVYYWPALENVTRFTHFQPSVPALAVLTWWLAVRVRDAESRLSA